MGTYLTLRFTAGRYHATPWGGHANEAGIEWPPSPWRILRALIATWHRKIDQAAFPDSSLAALVERLAATAPRYRLPPVVPSHTRHYMPVRTGAGDRPVLIFDAFARVDPETPLIAGWSAVDLRDDERELLSLLARGLGYLGRAESWVEARLVDDYEGPFDCGPAGTGTADRNATREPVRLLAPVTAGHYAEWREQTISELGLDARRLNARQKRVRAMLPERLVDALRVETADLRSEGWSLPPGATMITYDRPPLNEQTAAQMPRTAISPRLLTTARFALAGRPLPRIEDAVRIGEVVRAAAIRIADALLGADGVPAEISGHGLTNGQSHRHAFFLPEDADGDGRIDHVLIHAPGGLSPQAVATLNRIRRLWLDQSAEWTAILEGVWPSPGPSGSRYAKPARSWVSATPYLRPWFAKNGFGTIEQIRRECGARGLPVPTAVRRLSAIVVRSRERRPVHFHRFRSKRGLRQPDPHGTMLELTFDEPIHGPLALGFACHFGLGLFVPAER